MERSHDARPSEPPRHQRQQQPWSDSTSIMRWLQPGRSLQIPVGYAFISVAVVLILAFVTYTIGFSRGKSVGQLVYEEDAAAAGLIVANDRQPRDPVLTGEALPRAGERLPQSGPVRDRPGTTGGVAADWGPLVSDPREPGKMYYVLITTRESGARSLAQFCRDHGLEAYVLTSNNPSQFRVIALPGFRSEDRTSSEVRRLEQEIHRIGEIWSRSVAGATDLSGAYPSLYRGR